VILTRRYIYTVLHLYTNLTEDIAEQVVEEIHAAHITDMHMLRSENGSLKQQLQQKEDSLRRVKKERDEAMRISALNRDEIKQGFNKTRLGFNSLSRDIAMLRYERDVAIQERDEARGERK
jgi:hypothetical protein